MMGVKPASCKLVLLCLADSHNGDNGRCDPSVAFIAKFTGLDRKTVPDALATLEAAGLIQQVKRPGFSTQYVLQIAEKPVPIREKGARKSPVVIPRPKQSDLPLKRATPISGDPENGLPRKRTTTPPENGLPPPPKTGYEPTKNLPVKPTSSVAYATADSPPFSVDNSLGDLAALYADPNPKGVIFGQGVDWLVAKGTHEQGARSCLGGLIRRYGVGRTLDALITAMMCNPVDPKPYLLVVAAKAGQEILLDWEPATSDLKALEAVGVPQDIIEHARDVFVIWLRERGIRHDDFNGLFVNWCKRDWERVQGRRDQYRARLASSAGLPGKAIRGSTHMANSLTT